MSERRGLIMEMSNLEKLAMQQAKEANELDNSILKMSCLIKNALQLAEEKDDKDMQLSLLKIYLELQRTMRYLA
jgi:hypothetical protein